MSRLPTLLLLAALVLLGLRSRLSSPEGPAPDVPLLQPGSVEAETDAWRLRLVELTLTTGHVPRHDGFLDAPEGSPVPWPPLFPATLAALARHTSLEGRDAVELGSLDSREVLELVARVLPLLGALGVLAAYFTARALQGGAAAELAGLCAAALWALGPASVFAERAGRVDPHALSALLGFALVGATAFALRAREEIDSTLGGLLAGLAGGLGLACGVDTVVVLFGCLVSFGVAAWRARPGARRALALLVVTGLVVTTMAIGREASWSALAPRRVGWGAGQQALRYWLVVGLGPAALVALVAGWRQRARLATSVLLIGGLVWAALVDPGAAGVAVPVTLAAGVACADLFERLGPRSRVLAPLGLALLGSPAFAFRPPDPLRPSAVVELTAWRDALRWMRTQDPSPDPWSHPAARPVAFVLSAPSCGASIAAGARWAVLASTLDGSHSGVERAAEAARLLAAPAEAANLEALRVLGVRRVVVGPAMRGDEHLAEALQAGGESSLFEVLVAGEAVPAGVERLWPTRPGPTPVSVWRVVGSLDPVVPTVGPR